MNRLLIGASDKTTLLLQLLADDVAGGVTVIDSTGDFARRAATILPPRLIERALYLDPSDMGHPVGLNVLEGVPEDDRQRLTEDICAYFEAMWPNGWGAQSNFILANCLRLLLDTPGATLLGVLKLLTDKSYRTDCLAHCTDPVVQKNWAAINGWDQKQAQAAVAPLQNKIGTLLMSPMIRNIVGQSHTTFSKKVSIIIANLDRAKLGDTTARLLGGLLMARSSGQVFIHDFGFFASASFSSLLPQERLTLSMRFLDELPPALRQQILGIGEQYVFKTTKKDAEVLAFHVGIMNPRILTELAGEEAQTVGGVIEPQAPEPLSRLSALRKRTRAAHSRPRATVEKRVRNYFTGQPESR
jgi:hypothetical protein